MGSPLPALAGMHSNAEHCLHMHRLELDPCRAATTPQSKAKQGKAHQMLMLAPGELQLTGAGGDLGVPGVGGGGKACGGGGETGGGESTLHTALQIQLVLLSCLDAQGSGLKVSGRSDDNRAHGMQLCPLLSLQKATSALPWVAHMAMCCCT